MQENFFWLEQTYKKCIQYPYIHSEGLSKFARYARLEVFENLGVKHVNIDIAHDVRHLLPIAKEQD